MAHEVTYPFWISWWMTEVTGTFTLKSPWWITGRWNSSESVCAAVMAVDETNAQQIVLAAHDNPKAKLEWRFINRRKLGWKPFSDNFNRADWMVW